MHSFANAKISKSYGSTGKNHIHSSCNRSINTGCDEISEKYGKNDMNNKDTNDKNYDIESMNKAIINDTDKREKHFEISEETVLLSGHKKDADFLTDVTGFLIVCFIALVGDMARGIMFPTLWPLIKKLGGTQVSQGYAVAAFSFGRILSAPVLGRFSVSDGYTKTLLYSQAILLVGTLLYAQSGYFGTPTFLIVAQMVMGIGSGTLGVLRAFASDVSPQNSRTVYISLLTAVQYTGFTVTPLVGAFFAHYFSENSISYFNGLFTLDAYTAPAYFMTLMCSIIILLIRTSFQGRRSISAPKAKKSKKNAQTQDSENEGERKFLSFTIYEITLVGCMLLNFCTRGSIAVFETQNVYIAHCSFGLSHSKVGVIVGTCGAIGVAVLLSMKFISKILSDVTMVGIGMSFMVVGNMLLLNLRPDDQNPNWIYIMAIFFVYSVGYPIGNTSSISLFSKIVGRRPQGTLQGLFASAGSLARIIFPIASGYISKLFGLEPLLAFIIVVIVTCGAITVRNKKTLEKLAS